MIYTINKNMKENLVKLDKKDRQILFELDMNARMPLSRLAKKVSLSPQTAKYRIERLEKKGVIARYITLFDVSRFGFLYYRLYIRFENVGIEDEDEIIDFFMKHPNVVWFVSTAGRWDLEVLFIAKNFIHFNKILRSIYDRFPGKLQNNITSVSIANYHHPRNYLIGEKSGLQVSYGGEPNIVKIDKTDERIIEILNQNARLSSAGIGAMLDLSYKTIMARIGNLEKKGVIQAYRTRIDFSKYGYGYYKAMINLRRFTEEDEKAMLEFCRRNQNITYFITCVWPWNVEVEVEAESEAVFLDILRSFRKVFGNIIIDYEILTISKEHKLNYFPSHHEHRTSP